MLKAILTEKGLDEAKKGKYSFYVDRNLNKYQIKNIINNLFSVHVTSVRTVNFKAGKRRDYKGQYKKVSARKKAIVTLKEKESIDLFEVKK